MTNGGAGGAGGRATMQGTSGGSGGAGNPGGTGYYGNAGTNGTGGLLTIYSNQLVNNGKITSNGSNGGQKNMIGGGSGGGSINIFVIESPVVGEIEVIGGNYAGNGTISIGIITTGTYVEYTEE